MVNGRWSIASFLRKAHHLKYVVYGALLIVLVIAVQRFFIGSYRITGDNMADTLKTGDCIWVNKLKGKSNPGRNRLVLYRSPLRRDAADPPLFIGRCIGTPGDVIRMGTDGFRVNGRLLPNAPMMQPAFRIRKDIKEQLLTTMESLRIPLRDAREDSISLFFRMSLREKELLTRNLSQVVPIEMIGEHHMKYEFTVPRKWTAFDINEISLMVCKEAILNEAGDAAVIRNGKWYVNGEEKTT
ncbi:MAG: signal peptidase I [Tannerella sp.]|nr:signal peptidase I [Tannerella sp.]